MFSVMLFTGCAGTKSIFKNEQLAIENNITTIHRVIELLGKPDDEFATFACGNSSGSENYWVTFKRYGIAVNYINYFPETKGHKNNIISDIRIFDSTNISVKRSVQQRRYYEEDYFPIDKTTLSQVFVKPEKNKTTNSVCYFIYNKKSISFAFEKTTGKFLKLYVIK
jgi:hypothetical protein